MSWQRAAKIKLFLTHGQGSGPVLKPLDPAPDACFQ